MNGLHTCCISIIYISPKNGNYLLLGAKLPHGRRVHYFFTVTPKFLERLALFGNCSPHFKPITFACFSLLIFMKLWFKRKTSFHIIIPNAHANWILHT